MKKFLLALALIAAFPWLTISAVVGYAALNSMVCWARNGDKHIGVEGTIWLFKHCG